MSKEDERETFSSKEILVGIFLKQLFQINQGTWSRIVPTLKVVNFIGQMLPQSHSSPVWGDASALKMHIGGLVETSHEIYTLAILSS